MKNILTLIGMTILFACNNGEKKHTLLEDSLANVNKNINNELKAKDSLLNTKEAAMSEFISSFNEIQKNLNEIKAKEKIITISSRDIEFKKSNKDQVLSDIQSIYNLLGKNKQRVANLTKKLKDSNLKIEELDMAIVNLTNEMTQKEAEIADLKMQLQALNVDFTNLKMQYVEEKQESDFKTEKLNTAYYVVGVTKELTRKGVVTKEGGFIGIGKVAELNRAIDESNFTKIDIRQTTEIPVDAKKAKLITTHPEGSYKMAEAAGRISKLSILDPEKFWSVSKYLIITTDK